MQFYEIYAGGTQSGEIVVATAVAPDADGVIVLTERAYNSGFGVVGRERRGRDDYHEGYDCTSFRGGTVVLHSSEIEYNDPRIEAASRRITGE
jgi:hypothetical protein